MRLCIYTRKSVYSDKSDSVDNQERMCRDYADLKFPDIDSTEVYQDEGFTGANMSRPGLERLLEDVKDGLVDVLMVYQLDRLSRDVRDFSNIYGLLEEHHVIFLSIKENIDTATPIGRAMMYVTMVFAQMERETIAARVTDNMLGLAKKGYWTSGNPPYGYVRAQIVVDGKKHTTIKPDPEGVKYVEWIFDTFLGNNYSLSGLETVFKREGIRTIGGSFFAATHIHRILTMPYCAPTTPRIREYWIDQGCQVLGSEEEWDGTHGVIVYGRTTEKNKRYERQSRENWIVTVGAHQPFISEEKWLLAQERLHANIFEKKQKYDTPLLKGVLRCGKCGSLLKVARKKTKSGIVSRYYCPKRMRQGPSVCDMSMVRCDILDEKALVAFRAIEADPSTAHRYAPSEGAAEGVADIQAISRRIASQNMRIDRLTASLAEAGDSTARRYIVSEIERQDLVLSALQRELETAKADQRRAELRSRSIAAAASEIANLIRSFDTLSAAERNSAVRDVIRECRWDDESLFLTI